MPQLLGCAFWGTRPSTSLEPSPARGPLATGYVLGSKRGRRVRVAGASPRALSGWLCVTCLQAPPHSHLVGVEDDF